jgi:prenylcysteine oxidase / farnesylcysteine lyase
VYFTSCFSIISSGVVAEQIPIKIPSSLDPKPLRVAIVGSGISGASTAYFLHEKFWSPTGVEITVFEKEFNTGGRIQSTYLWSNSPMRKETGARHYYDEDWCMKKTVKDVGLQDHVEESYKSFSVFDGHNIIVQGPGGSKSWRDWLWWFYHYGSSPRKFQNAVLETANSWREVHHIFYTGILYPLEYLRDLLVSANEYVDNLGISEKFKNQIVGPYARSISGRNLDEQTAIEFLLSMRQSNRYVVTDGNPKLIERLLLLSRATVQTNTTVKSISYGSRGSYSLLLEGNESSSNHEEFDVVIIAAPLQSSGISFDGFSIKESNPLRPFLERHVTQFTIPYDQPLGQFDNSSLSQDILTTSNSSLEFYGIQLPSDQICHMVLEECTPGFLCEECVMKRSVRVISEKALSNASIAVLIGDQNHTSDDLDSLGVDWIHRQTWTHAFPQYKGTGFLNEIEIAPNMFYTGGAEEVISSMEMSCRTGNNLAYWLNLQFCERDPSNLSVCR